MPDASERNGEQVNVGSELKPAPRGPSRVTIDNFVELFTYHPPEDEEVIARYHRIREAAIHLAGVILSQTPGCADQQAAIRKVREAMMTANAAIATKGMC